MLSSSDLWLGLRTLGYRNWWSARYGWRWSGKFWYWRLSYILWLENWRGPAHHLGQQFKPPPGFKAEDFIYGETLIGTAHELLSWADLREGQHFCEIGCGRGVTTLVAAIVFGARVTAVEVIPALAARARWLAEAMQIELQVESDAPYPEAEVYFITPTTWSEENWTRVTDSLQKAPAGSRALVLSQPLAGWTLLGQRQFPFSWGANRVFLCLKP